MDQEAQEVLGARAPFRDRTLAPADRDLGGACADPLRMA